MLQVESGRTESLRERNIAQRRRRILDAARAIIAEGGVASLSMRRLAEQSGLAVKTLYNLWGGRTTIIEALTVEGLDSMDAALASEETPDDPIERCTAIITFGVKLIVSDHALYRPMVLAAYQGDWPRPEHHAVVSGRAGAAMTAAIDAGIATGQLRRALDTQMLGLQIYHSYEAAMTGWAVGAIDDETFLAAALYGLNVSLLAIAADKTRGDIERRIHKLERQLRARAARRGKAKGR